VTPIFAGRVTEAGALLLDTPLHFRAHLEKLREKRVEVTVRRERTQRSLDQNAYWHAVPVTLMAEYMGEEHMATHYALLGECFGYHWNEGFGRYIPNKGSSSTLTVEDFSHLIEWCPPWALAHHAVQVPLPNEVEVSP